MKTGDRTRELINAFCSGNLDENERSELEETLRHSPEARRLFLEYRATESALRSTAGVPVQEIRFRRRSWQTYALTGLAAALVALLASVLLFRPTGGESIATVTGRAGALLWTGDGGEVVHHLDPGDRISGGTLETLASDSWAEIEFPDGSTMNVSGQSAITISVQDGQKVMRLREGTLSVDAAKQPVGAPMLLTTPSAEARVLGTQFNVSADDLTTRVIVNEGLVEVERLTDGSVERVPENHLIVAELVGETDFKAVPRPGFVEKWKSDLPHDRRYGEWRPAAGDLPGAQQARPMLWRENPEKPMLLHVASIDPSPRDNPSVRLGSESRLRILGRLDNSSTVIFGLTTLHTNGGFAGKYLTGVPVEPDLDGNSIFEVELPIERFQREKEVFPESPLGLELADFWALTITNNLGLEIIQVELLK